MKKVIAVMLTVVMVMTAFCSCGKKEKKDNDINKNLDTSEEITLKLCAPWTDSKAYEEVARKFNKKYPNCTVEYEYVQNYDELLLKRLEESPDTVDIFLTNSIQPDSPYVPYVLNLFSTNDLDLSDTNDALIKNFIYKENLKEEDEDAKLYAIPTGGEIRGMYVNKTLLKSEGLDVPTNATELLAACKVLKEAGYVPMNGNPGMFGQRLMYPYVCNLISNSDNYEETYAKIANCEEGVSELFREPMYFVYELMENYYYNYKYVETELNKFKDTSDEGTVRDFLNIVEKDDAYEKVDDIGNVAFMSGTYMLTTTLEKYKEDYHSKIEYEFVLAPVSDEGGFAYVSPGRGIAVNKNSAHVDWAVEFLDFFFKKDINTAFAKDNNCIPNTKDSFSVIKEMFDVPDDRISDVGSATFDYNFYSIIEAALVEISKGNNPKYMDTDENGNSVLYDFDYYMEHLEEAFAKQRESES